MYFSAGNVGNKSSDALHSRSITPTRGASL